MYRPGFTTLGHGHHHCYRNQGWRKALASLLAPFTIWICVSVYLKYGFYADCRMSIGPSTSRLFKASSLIVEQVGMRDVDQKGVFLYHFSEKPELSSQTDWHISNNLFLPSYGRKGFYLWLNKGSSIRMGWAAPTSTLGQIQVSLIKGEQRYETLPPASTSYLGRETEYIIEEDDNYYIRIANMNPSTIVIVMNINVSSKMYNMSKAKSMCTTITGSCHLKFGFPIARTQYVLVTTPNNGDFDERYVEISFMVRTVIYIAILGIFTIIILIFLNYLEACVHNGQGREEEARVEEVTETSPLLPEVIIRSPYGTGEEEVESNRSSSWDDGKICVICYDKPRNCFLVPCGHWATCYGCAKRISDGESKVCPICRRLILKLRRYIIA